MVAFNEISDEELRSRLWGRRHELLMRCELSERYYRRRERFLSLADRGAKAVAVIGGSGAAAKVIADTAVPWIALVIAASSAISLVFGLGETARRNGELAAEYANVASQIMGLGERRFEEIDIDTFESKIRAVSAKEPAQLATLVTLVHNDINRARGLPLQAVPLYKRLFCQFWD